MRRGPLILGLTGSIGMGKSTVAKMFRRAHAPVFDADACVWALQSPGGRALPAIEAAFPGVTSPTGLDRAALAARVFGDPAGLRHLESILHPMVEEERRGFLRRHGWRRLVVLDVPLLFETGGERGCDAVAVVSAPARVQRARVHARPGMTPAKFARIQENQLPDAAKRARADFIIETGRGKAVTRGMVHCIVRAMHDPAWRRRPRRSSRR